MSSKTLTLAKVPMFQGLERSAIKALDARCRWRRVAAKEWVIDYHAPGIDVFFVVAGSVRVLIHSKTRRDVILADLDAGGVFGELAPIDGHLRSASVLALSNAAIAVMPGAVFLEVLQEHSEVSMYVLKMLAARIRALDNRVVEYSTFDVRHRVCCELLRLARPDPVDPRQGILSPAPTQAEIAARVSSNREVVSRTMVSLVREGYLQRRRNTVVLPDMPALIRVTRKRKRLIEFAKTPGLELHPQLFARADEAIE